MRMRLIVTAMALGLAATMGGSALAQSDQAAPAAAPPPDTVVAIIDDVKITRADVVASAATLPAQYQAQLEQIFPALIDRLVDLTLLANEARGQNLQDDPDVKTEVERLLNETISKTLITRHVKAAVTEEAIKARYEKMIAETPATVETKASHILLETEDEAKAVIAELAAGGDFTTLAKTKSKDPSAAQNGGDLGYFTAEQMVPEFSTAAFALEKGAISTAPTQSQFGWHVIMVVDRRDKAPPTFEESKAKIEETLSNEAASDYLKELRVAAKVELFNPDGTPRTDAAAEPVQQ
ncbi:MAG: peptidylprolyl isomerase [Dongiaceae bacterium]